MVFLIIFHGERRLSPHGIKHFVQKTEGCHSFATKTPARLFYNEIVLVNFLIGRWKMQTPVYVDVLLVLNYAVTALLVVCTAKLMGIRIKRREIVTAALLGSLGSLTIFLPFMGFFPLLLTRILLSGLIVLAALPFRGAGQFFKGWFIFFAVNFFFAGVMLGIWMLFAPSGMLYYNGVVYFNVKPMTLLLATVAAYLLLRLGNWLSRGGRLSGNRCRATIKLKGNTCALEALIDTGNSLYEPFSGAPVIVCRLEALKHLLEAPFYQALKKGDLEAAARVPGVKFRMVPYAGLGSSGALPAIQIDELFIRRGNDLYKAELVYAALSNERFGEGYDAILNPDLIRVPWTEPKGRVKHKTVV